MGKIYFVSDVHMRPHFARRASYFTAFLHSIQGAQALYMLGDIFDYWVGVGQLRKALADPVFSALRALRHSGTRLYFLGGNRDFLVGNELTRACGVEILPETAILRFDSLRVHVSHGDQFCTKDTDYLIFRTLVRNPVLTTVFKHLTPLFFRMWVAKLLRRSSKAIVKTKTKSRSKKTREINPVTVARYFFRGFDVLICGHIHQPRHVRMKVGDRVHHLYMLGHWDEGASYLVYDNGEFSSVPELTG
jgi:UDP-2,3-diacylglucosamine hydrolase